MKTFLNFLTENLFNMLGISFSLFGLYKDLWGGGNPQNAVAWVATLLIWCLNAKTDGDRKRAKAIKDRLDILARVLLPKFSDSYAISSYKKILEEEGLSFEEDIWYPCYFKPIGGQVRAHEVLDGLYNPSKKIFKLDPEFMENIKEGWNAYLEDHIWLQDNVLEYTMKETK